MSEDWPQAFERAAALRDAGEAIVALVRSGEIGVDEAHRRGDDDPDIGRVFALKVYEAIPGVGKVASRRAMEAVGIAEDVFLADVPADLRVAVAARFAEFRPQG